ncbi:hypothetical protein [Streptomyces sp. RFCAC02]|uniref:hypothetical protein n=1 Tax=Streptomyces sp. RFCAC02 TaxID=2499143 RepID=UPI00143DEF7C|nr:hypothetical protein [Streptomyces sp. RFCAC02]
MRGHAEIAQVWPRDGRLRLVGDLHGHRRAGGLVGRLRAPAPAGWSLLLILRNDRGRPWRLRCPADLRDTRFDVSLPVTDLAPDGLHVPAYWDVWLSCGEGRLRAGRRLDGVPDKKHVMVFPGQPVPRGRSSVLVRPYYTVNDNLSVEVLPAR